MMISISFADGDIFAHNIQRALRTNLFTLAAADTVFITIDEVLHYAIFFRPIMNSRRADVDAIATVNAFILREHHLKLAIEPFRVSAPWAANIAAFKKPACEFHRRHRSNISEY
jgi:hypothetical protein